MIKIKLIIKQNKLLEQGFIKNGNDFELPSEAWGVVEKETEIMVEAILSEIPHFDYYIQEFSLYVNKEWIDIIEENE